MAETPEQQQSPEEPQHSTAAYDQYSQPEKPIRNWTRLLTIFIAVLVLAGAGTGAYLYFKNHKSSTPKTTQVAQVTAPKISTATKSYTSPNLYLTLSYPANWTIVDSGGGAMTVTSPTMQLKDASGQEASGKIIMTMRTSAQVLPGFTAGNNATAVLASQKITYTNPTQDQRADTYLSFLSYSTTTASNGLDAIYVTGNNGYQQGQDIPQADLIQVSPVISLTFVDSTDKPLTIAASNWSDSAFSTPLLNMLKSLAIT